MMITYRSRFLTRAEVWFNNEPGDTRSADWIFYHQRSQPVPGAQTKYFYTFFIDLNRSREELLAQLNKDTAYKIRRARERDKIICEGCDPRDREVQNQYEQMYNTFAAMKGLSPLDRPRMEGMVAAGALDMSMAKDTQGNVLVYHANYRDACRATLLESPSLFRQLSDGAVRNLIGRANRYLIWSDIMRYKDSGLKGFDFGGWYHGNDPDMLKINNYKRGFGGQVVREYQCEQILTLKGWVVLRTASLLKQARLPRLRSNKPAAAPQAEPAHGPIAVPTE